MVFPKKFPSENRELAVKLAVLSVFTLVVVAFAVFSNNRRQQPPTTEKPKEASEVLGEESKNPVQDIQNLGTSVQDGASQLSEQAQQAAQNVLGEATQNIASFVVENAGSNLLQQIEKLPDQQQEELKKQICK